MTALPVSAPAVRAVRRRLGAAGWIGLAVFGGLLLACFASLPYTLGTATGSSGIPVRRYEAANLDLNLLPPSWVGHAPGEETRLADARAAGAYVPGLALGTDRLGRDYLVRWSLGGAVSLAIGISAAALSVLVGTFYGSIAGLAGARLDAALMRIVDILYGLPSVLLVVLIAVAADGVLERAGTDLPVAARQAINVATLLVAIGGVSWLTTARIIRGQVLSLRRQPFLESCRAAGLPWTRTYVRHLLPNLFAPISVAATLAVPSAILSESFLSFLGIGVREPLPSWGNLAAEGLPELNLVRSHWWLLLFPCLGIAAALLSLNYLGDAFRERFDPMRGRL